MPSTEDDACAVTGEQIMAKNAAKTSDAAHLETYKYGLADIEKCCHLAVTKFSTKGEPLAKHLSPVKRMEAEQKLRLLLFSYYLVARVRVTVEV
jgi:hypothetical protein